LPADLRADQVNHSFSLELAAQEHCRPDLRGIAIQRSLAGVQELAAIAGQYPADPRAA
jgi:hypothetical protein